VGSDIIPTLPIINYGTGIAPSLLNADISFQEYEYEKALLFGLNVKNVFHSIEDVKKYSINRENRFLN